MFVKCHGICTQEYVIKHCSVVFTTPVQRCNLVGQGDAHDLAMFLYLRFFFNYCVEEGQIRNWVESGGMGCIYVEDG
jgi:hypothetical protein